jgi:hypothetical protein
VATRRSAPAVAGVGAGVGAGGGVIAAGIAYSYGRPGLAALFAVTGVVPWLAVYGMSRHRDDADVEIARILAEPERLRAEADAAATRRADGRDRHRARHLFDRALRRRRE